MDMKRRWENGKQYLYLSAPLNLCQYSGHQKCDSYAAPAV